MPVHLTKKYKRANQQKEDPIMDKFNEIFPNVRRMNFIPPVPIEYTKDLSKIKKYIKSELIRIQNGKQKYITPLLEFIMNLIKN